MPFSQRALQRIANVEPHAPDALDLEVDDFAVLQRSETLVVGSARDHVAGIERHDGRCELDELRHEVLHVVGVVVVPQLAVDPETHEDVVGIGDLVERRDARPERRERIERLAEPAAGFPRAPAFAARRDVDHAGVAEDGAFPVLGLDHLGRPLDDERELGLVHEDPGLAELRQHDRVAGPDHRIRILQEHVERPRRERPVLPVVGDAGEDLSGARQRRAQPDVFQRRRGTVLRAALQRGTQPVEVVDDARHRELRRRAAPRPRSAMPTMPRSVMTPGRTSASFWNRASFTFSPDRALRSLSLPGAACSPARARRCRTGSSR